MELSGVLDCNRTNGAGDFNSMPLLPPLHEGSDEPALVDGGDEAGAVMEPFIASNWGRVVRKTCWHTLW